MQTINFSEQATHHVSLVLDSDEGLYNYRRAMVEQAFERARVEFAGGEEPRRSNVAHHILAEMLKDWAEELVGMGGEEYGLPELTMLNRELVGLALAHVDWDKLAADYMDEENES